MPKRKTLLAKGKHVVCKYALTKGKNGDLIVARVESVRSNGDVVLTNLLLAPGAKKSIKKFRVLMKRNQIVPKVEALKIVKIFEEKGYPAARQAAVKLAARFSPVPRRSRREPPSRLDPPINPEPSPVLPAGPTPPVTVVSLVMGYKSLNEDDKKAVAKVIFKEALELLGVD